MMILTEILQLIVLLSQIYQADKGGSGGNSQNIAAALADFQQLVTNIQTEIAQLPPNGQLTNAQIGKMQADRHAAVAKWGSIINEGKTK